MQRIGRFSYPLGLMAVALAVTSIPASYSQNVGSTRIRSEISGSSRVALPGSLNPLARAEFDQGRVDPAMKMEGVTLVFKPSASQQKDLQRLLAEQQDSKSPNFHKWLTPEEFGARFGMSQSDLDQVTAWLQSQGFEGIRVARNRNQISFNGNAAQVDAGLGTELHYYQVNGAMHFASALPPSVPAAMAGAVLGIRHLNDFHPKPKLLRPAEAHFTSGTSGNHFLSPGDLAVIYNLQPLYDAGIDGTGETIAVIGQTQIDIKDANRFRSLNNLPANPPQPFLVPGTGASTVCSSDLDEANLDVEWSGALAKNATVVFVYAGVGTTTGSTCSKRNSDVFDALQYAIDNNLAPVIGLSYGLCETQFMSSNARIVQQWAQQANAQGQTISAASGDAGAADCDTGAIATLGLSVDVPASVPEVTGVGGTEFSADNSNPSTYWTSASGSTDLLVSAKSFIPEMSWNDSPTTGTGPSLATSLFSSGGGPSAIFAKPSWQTTPAISGETHREVPDIALAGSPDHDGYLVCSQGSCVDGFRLANGDLTVFGGTSVDSQAFAGMLAVLNQATESGGLGPVNAELYSLAASTPAAFHDTTTGTNIVPCTAGTPATGPAAQQCPSSGKFGYSAKAGYDVTTGLGSVDLDKLATAWPGFTATPAYSISSNPGTVSIASAGASGSSTISVATMSGFTGTVSLSCALYPTTAQATCSIPASVALDGSSTPVTATLTVNSTAAHAVSNASAKARSTSRSGWMGLSSGLLVAGILMAGVPRRRRGWMGLLGVFFCVLLVSGIGCGGGSTPVSNSGGNSGGGTTTPGTPAGSYTVVVTGSSGNISHGASVAVTVQ
jgi:subtilase family serine protease